MLSNALKYMRKTNGLKQQDIANMLKTARTTISSYESDYRQPTFEIVEAFANKCGYEIYFVNKKKNDKFKIKDLDRKDI